MSGSERVHHHSTHLYTDAPLYVPYHLCAGTYFYSRGVRQEPSQPGSSSEQSEEEIFLGADGRATSAASSAESQKFLNSGCILGTFYPGTGGFVFCCIATL
jgi:hypothetical protein